MSNAAQPRQEMPTEALVESIRAVSLAASQDPTAVLEELARQAEALLGCDGASIHLAVAGGGDDLVFRRVRVSAFGQRAGAEPGSTWRADPTVLASLRAGRGLFVADFQPTVQHELGAKPWLRQIASALYAPLIAADAPLGVLVAAWGRPRPPDQRLLTIADALAGCAAVAVHQARLLERAQHAHAELAAVLDAAEDSILVFDRAGTLLHANRHGRERLATNVAHGARSVADLQEAFTPIDPATRSRHDLVGRALQGEHGTALYEYRDAAGGDQRVHLSAAPIREPDGAISGAVVIARNITALHNAIAESGRLDGAIKTARLVAHQVNNQLSPVRGYGELLLDMTEGQAREFAERIVRAADAASATVARLQRIIRFEETDQNGYPMLDLDAAAPDDNTPKEDN